MFSGPPLRELDMFDTLRLETNEIVHRCQAPGEFRRGTILSLRDDEGCVLWGNGGFHGGLVDHHRHLPVKSYDSTLHPIAASERRAWVDRSLTRNEPSHCYQIGVDRVLLWSCIPVYLTDLYTWAVIASCSPEEYVPGTFPIMQSACMDRVALLQGSHRSAFHGALRGDSFQAIGDRLGSTPDKAELALDAAVHAMAMQSRDRLLDWGRRRHLHTVQIDVWDQLIPLPVFAPST